MQQNSRVSPKLDFTMSLLRVGLQHYHNILRRNGYVHIKKAFKTARDMENLIHQIVYTDNNNDGDHVTYGVTGILSRSPIDKTSPNVVDVGCNIPSYVTVYPHNEMGYDPFNIPEWIGFGCFQPAMHGGYTKISNVTQFTKDLPTTIKQKFKDHGVMYQRILHDGNQPENEIYSALSFSHCYKSYQEYFGVNNLDEIQHVKPDILNVDYNFRNLNCAICLSYKMNPWLKYGDDQQQPEILVNSVVDTHGTYFDAFPIEFQLEYNQRPTHSKWGNGEEFTDQELKIIHECYNINSIELKLEKGDILLLNNILWTHSRTPFIDSDDQFKRRKIGAIILGKISRA